MKHTPHRRRTLLLAVALGASATLLLELIAVSGRRLPAFVTPSPGALTPASSSSSFSFVEFLCADALDNDRDNLIDMDDPDCVVRVSSTSSLPVWEISCTNALDDDGDRLVDMDDPDCAPASSRAPLALYELEVACANARDDNGNSLIDMDDPDCSAIESSADPDPGVPVSCRNTRDEDSDGLIDMDDPDCVQYVP